MGTFDASKIAPIDYDLSVYKPDPDADGLEDAERERRRQVCADPSWAGVIPEPPREAVVRFFNRLQDIRLASLEDSDRVQRERRETALADYRAQHEGTDLTDDQVLMLAQQDETIEQTRERIAMLQSIQASASAKAATRIGEAVAELTGDHPSQAVFLELQQRPADMFVAWLSGEFSPEAVAAAMQQ